MNNVKWKGYKRLDGRIGIRNKIFGRIPMSKVGSPEDIGNSCIYLSSKAASYINGICLPVDGGALIGF